MIRILAEFHEMPCLCLTLPQVARLMGLDLQAARDALTRLVERGELVLRDGQYRRA